MEMCYFRHEQQTEQHTEHQTGQQTGQQTDHRSQLPIQRITNHRLIIHSCGEGAIRVNNENGPIENGDLITTSSKRGIGMKQHEPFVTNYTVAKATENIAEFDEDKTALIGCIYYP
jgi:hypothetical protein